VPTAATTDLATLAQRFTDEVINAHDVGAPLSELW
jgi:hypothetical protein